MRSAQAVTCAFSEESYVSEPWSNCATKSQLHRGMLTFDEMAVSHTVEYDPFIKSQVA